MDFDKLIQILPKQSSKWSTSDIQIWLNFIGLSSLIPQFKKHQIDGSCLSQLTQQDFKNELQITSKIIVKKIMNWITLGIHNFDIELKKYLELEGTLKERAFTKKQNQMMQSKKCANISKMKEWNRIEPIKRQNTYNGVKKQQFNQLIIKQCDVVQAANYSLKQSGGMIGRHSTNQILVLDEFVSRFHAQIQFEDGEYYIRDCGSSSGSFIRIIQKIQLRSEMIIELGSNQFEINLQEPEYILMKIIQGPNVEQIFKVSRKNKSSIGRKTTNQINFIDDQHLSNIHATIFCVGDVCFLEDFGTTNGTWLRLSREGVKSQRFRLDDKTQFKLSSNLIYECRRSKTNRKTSKEKSQKCIFCGVADCNAIFMPCKHNIGCFECSTSLNLTKCDLCGSAILDLVKIFTV